MHGFLWHPASSLEKAPQDRSMSVKQASCNSYGRTPFSCLRQHQHNGRNCQLKSISTHQIHISLSCGLQCTHPRWGWDWLASSVRKFISNLWSVSTQLVETKHRLRQELRSDLFHCQRKVLQKDVGLNANAKYSKKCFLFISFGI